MDQKNYIYSKKSQILQISHGEYLTLMEKIAEAQRLQQLKATVIADLQRLIVPGAAAEPVAESKIEPVAEAKVAPVAEAKSAPVADAAEVPPIKKEISRHFNKMDTSGRLFNVFNQYYTFLNEACGGIVSVTIKDGFCSLWNYDEWEEFAFIDIFEGHLRIAVSPRYTDELKALNLCEVPRLLSNRRNLICLQVDDLNKRVLDVLAKAFAEVGMLAK